MDRNCQPQKVEISRNGSSTGPKASSAPPYSTALIAKEDKPSLAEGMRNLNSRYGQRFNRLHGRVGHVFQGRYKAILVEQPGYLLELARYIVLNPVRAGRVVSAVDWPWSSYRAMLGLSPALGCLDVTYLLRQFSDDPARAREGFAAFVAAGDPAAGAPAPGPHPLVHGGAAFINQVFGGVPATALGAEIPRLQRASLTLHELEQQATSRNDAMRRAWATGHYPLAAIARHFGVHYTTVSRICRSAPLAAARVPEETNGNSG